ncbi:MAG: hypothetical protein LBH81_03275 [Rickettsiales bacterium]|jgi:DNA polymerase-1|nr:hypothetical protein [Rickettsiales bacterium]
MLTIIDGNNLLFRAFYGIKGNLSRRDGTPTNALYGFCAMILNLLAKARPGDSFAVAFDASRKNFRHAIYGEYKANRAATPDALRAQIPLSRGAVRAMGIESVEIEGFEADDIIATLARRRCNSGESVVIVSSDKDLMQLISDCATIYDGMKEQVVTRAEATQKFGVPPEKIPEVQAIIGDSSDNIPGVPGLGPKAAAKLITEFGSLDGVYENIAAVSPDRVRNLLTQYKDSAYMSRKLAVLDADAPVPADAGTLSWRPDIEAMASFFQNEIESPSLVARAKKLFMNELPPCGGVGEKLAGGGTIANESDLRTFLFAIKSKLAISIESFGGNYMSDRLRAIRLFSESGSAHVSFAAASGSLFGESAAGISPSEALRALKPVLENPNILKIGSSLKLALHLLANEGADALEIGPLADIGVMAYALGSGAAKQFVANSPDELLGLYDELKGMLDASPKAREIYEKYDAPLLKVLFKLERAGVELDKAALARLSVGLHIKMQAAEKEIIALAGGREINLASPQQLAALLFGTLGIRNPKKNSTDASVLGGLINDHPIIEKVLEWRKLAKLVGTYTDALPKEVAGDGRIHSTFLQTSTNTGRLSSQAPNLQNIPVKGEAGATLRACFVAAPGNKFVIADYSQIQLRLLAVIADVPALKQIFASGKDIHCMTAHKIFGTPLAEVSAAERRAAKTVNFSIVYGVSAFGLATQLGIANAAAQKLIDSYFASFPEIRAYNERVAEFAKEHAFVETPAGRRVDLPEIRTPALKAYALRAATNAPIQGAEADLMRLAAIEVDRVLEGTGAKLVLQVHDELVVECPEGAADEIARKVKAAMEGVGAFDVPLPAETTIAGNLE